MAETGRISVFGFLSDLGLRISICPPSSFLHIDHRSAHRPAHSELVHRPRFKPVGSRMDFPHETPFRRAPSSTVEPDLIPLKIRRQRFEGNLNVPALHPQAQR